MSYLMQNLAAESDYRTTAIDERWWGEIRGDQATVVDYNEEDDARWVRIRFEVCPACQGKGQYVNPSVDAHGLTSEDFEDYDFREDYFGGMYDVDCTLCRGEKVVPVPLDPAILAEVVGRSNDLAQVRAEQLAEMRAGA